MGRIDDTLWMRSQFAAAGATFTDADLWTKAFRLKRFGRCPWCDAGVKSWRDVFKGSTEIRCTSCEFVGEIFDIDFHRAADSDDPIIALIRDACGFGHEAVDESKKSRVLRLQLSVIALAVFVIAAIAIATSTF